jgi:hypothetical protein
MNVTPWVCWATSAAVFNDIGFRLGFACLVFRVFGATQRIAAQGREGHRNENAVALRRTPVGPDCSICFCCAAPSVITRGCVHSPRTKKHCGELVKLKLLL